MLNSHSEDHLRLILTCVNDGDLGKYFAENVLSRVMSGGTFLSDQRQTVADTSSTNSMTLEAMSNISFIVFEKNQELESRVRLDFVRILNRI